MNIKRNLFRFIAILMAVVICYSCSGCMALTAYYVYEEVKELTATPRPDSGLNTSGKFEEEPEATPEASPEATPTVEADSETIKHGTTPFGEIVYERPDTEAIKSAFEKVNTLAAEGADFEEISTAYDEAYEMYEAACGMYVLAYLHYYLDLNDEYYNDEQNYLYEELTEVERILNSAVLTLVDGEYSQAASEKWSAYEIEETREEAKLNSASVAELLNRNNELQSEYDSTIVNVTVDYNDHTWTYDDVANRTWKCNYSELLEAYLDACADAVEDIFMEMIEVRTQIAEGTGYDSYSEYCYAGFDRDYSTEDSEKLWAYVKDEFADFYFEELERYYNCSDLYDYESLSIELEDAEELLAKLFSSIDGSLAESYSYMLEYDLCDLLPAENKTSGAFTTYIYGFNSPFMLANYEGYAQDVSTLVHEMGHFNFYYHNDGESLLDLDEVDSQGLELLATHYYRELYGDECADIACVDKILDICYSVVSGCLEDEFQQTIYDNPDMTYEEIKQLYADLNDEYGLSEYYYTFGSSFVTITHTFDNPLYYISYAVSAINSLNLWLMADEDFEAACETYTRFVERDCTMGYYETLEEYGFSDPFDVDYLSTLTETLHNAMDNYLTEFSE